MAFVKATKKQAKLRLALTGPAGSGKTFTGLSIATHLGGRIAVLDTEHGTASKYADADAPTGTVSAKPGLFAFDALELDDFNPKNYIAAIADAVAAKYDVLLIDSLSHAWAGKGGALDMHDQVVARQKTENKYTAWAPVTKIQNELIEALIAAPLHLIVTMRSKMDYVQEGGKVRKVGMAPIQRDGVEYEFDVVGDLDRDNTILVSKTRCSALQDYSKKNPGKEMALILKAWLEDGAVVKEQPPMPPQLPASPPKQDTRPQTTQEFLLRLAKKENAFMELGLCSGGELLPYIAQRGQTVGLMMLEDWKMPLHYAHAVQFVTEFEKQRKRAPTDPEEAELLSNDMLSEMEALMSDTATTESDVLRHLGLPPVTKSQNITVAKWRKAMEWLSQKSPVAVGG